MKGATTCFSKMMKVQKSAGSERLDLSFDTWWRSQVCAKLMLLLVALFLNKSWYPLFAGCQIHLQRD
jgi:hypothetical protein